MPLKFIQRYTGPQVVSSFHSLAASSSDVNYGTPSIQTGISILKSLITPSPVRPISFDNIKIFTNAFDSRVDITYDEYRKAFEDAATANRHMATLFIYHTLPNLKDSAAISQFTRYLQNYSWYPVFTRTFRTDGSTKGPSLLETIFLTQDNHNIKLLVSKAQKEAPEAASLIQDAISHSILINPLMAETTLNSLEPELKTQLAEYYKKLDYLSRMPAEEVFKLLMRGDVTTIDGILSINQTPKILKIKSPDGRTLLQLAERNTETYQYLMSKMTYQEFQFVALFHSGLKEDAARIFQALASNDTKLREFFTLAKQLDDASIILSVLHELAHITERDDIIEFLVNHDYIDTIKFLSESETTADRVKIKLGGDAPDSFLIAYQESNKDEPGKLELMKKFIKLGADPLSGGDQSAMALAVTSGNQHAVKHYLDVMASETSTLDHLETVINILDDRGYFLPLLKLVATYSTKLQQFRALQKAINAEGNEHSKAIVKIITIVYADSEDDFTVFKAFLDNAADHEGYSPELTGIAASIVEYLNDQKIFDINKKARNGDKTSLVGHYASTNTPEAFAALKTLLSLNEVNLEVEDKNGHTPLMAALANKCISGYKLLLEAGGNKNAQNSEGEGLLHVAMENDIPEILEEITIMLARDKAAKYHCSMQDAIKMVTEEIALNSLTPLRCGLQHGAYSAVTTLLLKHNVILNDEILEMAQMVNSGCTSHPVTAYPKILDFVFAYSVALLQNNIAQFKRDFDAAKTEAEKIIYVNGYLSKLIASPEAAARSDEDSEESSDEDDGGAGRAAVSPTPLEDLKNAFISYLESLRESENPIILRIIYEFIDARCTVRLDNGVAETQLTKHVAYSEEIAKLQVVYSKALSSEALQDPEDTHTACGSGGEASSHKEVKESVAQTDPADFKLAKAMILDLTVNVSDSIVDIAPEILGASSAEGDLDN